MIECFYGKLKENCMKITGKLLGIYLLLSFYALSANAESIQFGRKRNTKKENNINTAQIKDDEGGIASTTFSNLPKNEVINTFYADPLSDEFMGHDNKFHDSERNRTTKDLLSEFEGQVKVINDNTDIPDEEELLDTHSKEDRARIEARADQLLKEAAIQESKNNTGEVLLENSADKISEKLNKNTANTSIASYTDLYKENASETVNIIDNTSSKEENSILTNDQPEEDPEFSNHNANEEVVIVEENLSNETDEIPNYEELEGLVTEEASEDTKKRKKKKAEEDNEKQKVKTAKKNKLAKKMAEPLDPVLLTEGKPKSADDESEKVFTFSGLLIPEKQPLGRKKHMLRWVLQLDDGSRIPLKSNLKLMQEVRKESNLTDYVTISGKMKTSALEKELKYLVPDSLVKGFKNNKKNESNNNKTDSNSEIESLNDKTTKPDTNAKNDSLKEVSKLPETSSIIKTE